MQYVLQPTQNDILHFGKGHDDNPPGRGSGRYPWGSGKEPGNKRKEIRAAKKARKKAIKKYDYRASDVYQNSDRKMKMAITARHRALENIYGEKATKRIEYGRDIEGIEESKLIAKEIRRALAVGLGGLAISVFGPTLISEGASKIVKGFAYAKTASTVAENIGKQQGLNVVKGGFTLGLKHIEAGKKIIGRL